MDTFPLSFTVATYNIHHGHDVHLCWEQLATPVAEAQVDILCLQEVDVGTRRVGGQNTVAVLKQAIGFSHAVFAPAMRYGGGEYGLAILTRYPFLAHELIQLPTTLGAEPRVAVQVSVEIGGRIVHVLNTHLDHRSSALRSRQSRTLQDHLPLRGPWVLAGDLNTSDVTDVAPLLAGGCAMVNDPRSPLMTFREPSAAIDHILYAPRDLVLLGRGMVDSPASDHNLLWGRFGLLET